MPSYFQLDVPKYTPSRQAPPPLFNLIAVKGHVLKLCHPTCYVNASPKAVTPFVQ